MSQPVAIIGAGLAGLVCAASLAAAGPVLFDKGRRPGGRLATRHLSTPQGPAAFDHGAQYFTVRDPAFAAQNQLWAQAGLTAPWPEAGPDAFVATPAMNSLAAHLAQGLDIRAAHQVTALTPTPDGWQLSLSLPEGGTAQAGPFPRLILAVPAENAATLLAPVAPGLSAFAAAVPSAPCWTVLAALPEPLPGGIWRHLGAIGWAARNNAKPGRSGPEALLLQAGPDWTRAHLEDMPQTIGPALLAEFFAATGLPAQTPLAVQAHRWRYARAGAAGTPCVWQPETGLGLCGDWLLGPRLEAAFLSGRAMAAALG